MSISQRLAVTAVMLGAAGVLGACGDAPADGAGQTASASAAAPSSSPTKKPEPRPKPEQAVVDVIVKFQRAVDKGDGKRACALLTKELQGVYAQNPGASDCPGGIEHLHKELGDSKLSALKIAAADVEISKGGKEAVANHKLIAKRNRTDPDETDSYNMENEKGRWKISYIG